MEIGYTIGPSSWDASVEDQLLEYATAVRYPFAKETPDSHIERAQRLRNKAELKGIHLNLIADLPGEKPRFSNSEPFEVDTITSYRILLWGQRKDYELRLEPEHPLVDTAEHRFPLNAVVGDGELIFQINSIEHGLAAGFFLRSGTLERKRALTLPGYVPTGSTASVRDRATLQVIAGGPFDWVALSFVESGGEVARLRKWVRDSSNWTPKFMAKIETSRGVDSIESIAMETDGVMLARGDLALHVSPSEFLSAQLRVLQVCNALDVPCYVATGYLESMISRAAPTRAEVTDFLWAQNSGATGVLFSSETTIGCDPREVLRVAKSLIGFPER